MPNGTSHQRLAWPGCAALALLALTCAPAHPAGHAIFKCSGADGKTVFSDRPCTDNGAQQALTSRGGTVQPVPAPAEAVPAAAPKGADSNDCSTWMPPDGDVAVALPGKVDPEMLPHDASGRPIDLFVSKRGPGIVAASCSAMVAACAQKSNDPGASVDACFKSAPRCTTAQPWDEEHVCCPQACWQKFSDLRRHCVGASQASYKALFEEHCAGGGGESPQAPKTP